MAAQPLLNLLSSIGASGGLQVTGDTGSATGSPVTAVANLLVLAVTGASGNPTLPVKFV